jgi:hypothetical protein
MILADNAPLRFLATFLVGCVLLTLMFYWPLFVCPFSFCYCWILLTIPRAWPTVLHSATPGLDPQCYQQCNPRWQIGSALSMGESLTIDSRLLDIVDYSQGLTHSAAQRNPRAWPTVLPTVQPQGLTHSATNSATPGGR